MNNKSLPQFLTDLLISWDISDRDFTIITVSQMRREGTHVVGEIIGLSHEKTGCVSIRQVMEEYGANKRREEMEARK